MSSESIWLCSKVTQVEINNEVELEQIFRPVSLPVSEDLDSGKVGKVLVVSNNIYWKVQTLQVVLPNLECLKDCKEFFFVNVIIEFWSRKDIEVECNKINIRICRIDRKNSTECIIRSVSLNNNLSIQYPVCKHWCRYKSFFKSCKCLLI